LEDRPEQIGGTAAPGRAEGTSVRRLFRNASWLFSGNALASLLGFAQAVVLGRALGVDGYGLLAFIIAFVTTVNSVVDIRVWESVTKFVGDYHARGEHGRARATVKLAYLVDLGTGVIAFALVAALAPLAADRFVHDAAVAPYLVLYAGTLLVATVNDTSMALLRVFDRFRWLSTERVASAVVRLALLWAAAALTGRLGPVLVAYVAVELGRGLVLLVLGLRASRAALTDPGPDHLGTIRGRFAEFRHFTLQNAATTVLSLITRQLDILILTAIHAPREVALYRMARNFGQLLARITDPVYHAIYPELVRLAAIPAASPGEIRTFIVRSMRIVLPVILLVGLIAVFGARLILERAVGSDFVAATLPLQIIVGGALIHASFLWARPLVLATGRPQISTIAHAAGAVTLVLASILLVPRFGAVGSAITFVLVSAVTVGVLAFGATRRWRPPGPGAGTWPAGEAEGPD
jgi:O-antigen/teichoic acid export membrane protein